MQQVKAKEIVIRCVSSSVINSPYSFCLLIHFRSCDINLVCNGLLAWNLIPCNASILQPQCYKTWKKCNFQEVVALFALPWTLNFRWLLSEIFFWSKTKTTITWLWYYFFHFLEPCISTVYTWKLKVNRS